ncbi:MAG: molybdenum cofactor biosynthesis protein B [Gammaproteobacteria bacterium]|nr:molybdenum cofactor biosynthesis protein B [Gammaproteobacteria bacterium]
MTPLNCSILTISDSRTLKEDTSGALLAELIAQDGHRLAERTLVPDSIYEVRATVSRWIADAEINVVVTTGGTGFTGRDSTPEALLPLFDKTILGFGELFRQISFDEIGASTIQSRAVAGIANATLIFALPGSSNAVRTGWDKILHHQLDVNFKPCNFVELIPRFLER